MFNKLFYTQHVGWQSTTTTQYTKKKKKNELKANLKK